MEDSTPSRSIPGWVAVGLVVGLAVIAYFALPALQGQSAAQSGNLAAGLQKSINDKLRPAQQLLEDTKLELWNVCVERLENGSDVTEDCAEVLADPPIAVTTSCEDNQKNGKPLTVGCSAFFAAQLSETEP